LNWDKKDNGCISKKVHALGWYTKYTLIGTTHAQTPNKGSNPLGVHDDILAILDHQSEKQDLSIT